MSDSKLVKANQKIAEGVAEGNRKIAEGVSEGFGKISDAVVGGYTKIEDRFVDTFLKKEGETVEDAKKRLAEEQKRIQSAKGDTGTHDSGSIVRESLERAKAAGGEARKKAGL